MWRGCAGAVRRVEVRGTGYAPLDEVLTNRGWPQRGVIEVCQGLGSAEWRLFHYAIANITRETEQGVVALISPAAHPFIEGLRQLNITSSRLLIIQAAHASDTVNSFCELSQSPGCAAIFTWQDSHPLSYTQLRKMQLSAQTIPRLHVLFRPMQAKAHNSPASLRLSIALLEKTLDLEIIKQRGNLQHSMLALPLSDAWWPHADSDGHNSPPLDQRPRQKHRP